MPCPRCHRLREFETVQREYEDQTINGDDNGNVSNVRENVVEGYVYVSAIREPNFTYFNPYDQCFCRDQALLEQERRRTGIEIPGKCYPVAMCSNCDLNYSGLCPQQNKYDSGIYVNEIPVYPIIPPYVRPAYYPYTPWYPRTHYRPSWRPNGYGPRPKPYVPRQERPTSTTPRGSLGPQRGTTPSTGGRRGGRK